MKERKERLESHAYVLRGLIHYHERMMAGNDAIAIIRKGTNAVACSGTVNKECPAVKFSNDIYLEALKEALSLIEKELSEL